MSNREKDISALSNVYATTTCARVQSSYRTGNGNQLHDCCPYTADFLGISDPALKRLRTDIVESTAGRTVYTLFKRFLCTQEKVLIRTTFSQQKLTIFCEHFSPK
ncbi:uncharacterized protein LOC112693533 [Sipha flava]|uniref:Uncharacterized protein LOC112693533 n=1 Tax=Sipha flava TaxID=143950 RepID=A0A8B8GN53_9HEMI|nr:uncharacterized protein LOC112693533 [Sipha flava]